MKTNRFEMFQLVRALIVFSLIFFLYDAIFTMHIPRALKQGVKALYSMRRMPGRPIGKQSIAMVTFFKSDDFRQLTQSNMELYCKNHGYDLIILNDHPEILDSEAASNAGGPFIALKKILMAPASLDHKLYDWIMWAEEDTLFLNMARSLEEIADNRYDFIISIGYPDEDIFGSIVDTRHMLIRNSKNALEILSDLEKLSREHCGQFIIDHPGAANTLNGWLHICNTDGTFWSGEAGMLLALYTFRPPEYRCRFKKINHRIMNSQFPAYEDGDLAVSFPDHMIESKKLLIKAFLQYTNFNRGWVDRSFTDKLDPVDPGNGNWQTLEDIYDLRLNVFCEEE